MKNLFVVHTQYSLSLITGLKNNRFNKDLNDLILIGEFNVQPEIIYAIKKNFKKIIIIKGVLSKGKKNGLTTSIVFLINTLRVKKFISTKYNRIFITNDMSLPEMHIMKKAYSLNPAVEFIALEDGAYPYFLNYATSGGLDTNNFTRHLRKILFKYLLGCGKFYSFEGRFMGANTWLKSIYLTYKDYARDIYNNKNRIEITATEFNTGIDLLFQGTNTTIQNNSVVLILDKLDVYKNRSSINLLIAELVTTLLGNDKTIYYKYHPREDQQLDELKDCNELNRNIAIESYYKDFLNNKPIIIGIKSTGLQTAKKMGFDVISLAKVADEHNEDVLNFYEKIGITILDDIKQFNQLLA